MNPRGSEGGEGGHFGGFGISSPGDGARHFQGEPHKPGDAPRAGQTDPAKAEAATYVRHTRRGAPQLVRGRVLTLAIVAILVSVWVVIEMFRMFTSK